jgi:glycerol-3-phosphate dehydrogenase
VGHLARYGTDAGAVVQLLQERPELAEAIDPEVEFTFAEVVYAMRHEMARTVEDVLSRRMRALLLDAKAAYRAAPVVAELMAKELGRPAAWAEEQVKTFQELARKDYMLARTLNSDLPTA